MNWFRQSWVRIPFRELAASPAKFGFVVLAVAVGVGALTGVRSFSQSFRTMLLSEARTLMAGDVMIRIFDPPNEQQTAMMESLANQGILETHITETVSMVSSDHASAPALVAIKAVDPKVYPFYGEVGTTPPGKLADLLTADTVGVSDDLLLRLGIKVGDPVRVGRSQFRVAAVINLEPDRMTGTVNVGPRMMITREGLARADLIHVGSTASERFLFRIPPGTLTVAQLRGDLESVFHRGMVTDYRETNPRITRGLNQATTFLSLVSLIALVVGSLGVAMAMQAHLAQRMDTIAVMKCLGAKSGQIIRIYLLQTLLLGAAGGLAGVAVGSGIQAVFPSLIERYFQLRPDIGFQFAPAIQGMAIGILSTLLFTLPPLLRIRDVRPAVIFRRDMAEKRKSFAERWRGMGPSFATGGLILAGVGGITVWLGSDNVRGGLETSMYFVGGLVFALVLLSGVAWALLRSLKLMLRRTRWKLPTTLRHGAANLYRPGNHAEAVLVALGVGVMFTFTVYLVQHGLLQEMIRSAPPDMPNVFLINITERERAGVEELLKSTPGVLGDAGIYASAEINLVSVDGQPPRIPQNSRRWRRNRTQRDVTWIGDQPAQLRVVEGTWWPPGSNAATDGAQLCVSQDQAEELGVHPGSVVEWSALGRTITSTVSCIDEVEEVRFGARRDFIFNPGALDGIPTNYFGGARMEASAVPAFQRASYNRFPTVTVINGAEVLEIVQDVIDQVAMVVRFISLFAILAGVIILASSVAGSRFRRIREAAILKTVGATRRRVITVFSLEFFILGSVAGLMGVLLATGFADLLLRRMLDAPLAIDWEPMIVAVVATALIAVFAGWTASFRILGQKPLEVLRNE